MNVVAVIPARGGSKGVARKNLREVGGEPLLAYAVHAARAASRVSGFLVSTDDDELADLAGALSCPVLRRPTGLAGDEVPMAPVLRHALLAEEARSGNTVDAVLLLQPTSPIRTGADVDAVVELLEAHPEADSVVSVCRTEDAHPARMYRIGDDGRLEALWPEWQRAQRQGLPEVYYRNGALYGCRRALVVERGEVIGDRPVAYEMPARLLANVDDDRDLLIADALVRAWKDGRL